jgi:hypothetical protein
VDLDSLPFHLFHDFDSSMFTFVARTIGAG